MNVHFWKGVAVGLFLAALPTATWAWLAAGLVLAGVLILWPVKKEQPAVQA